MCTLCLCVLLNLQSLSGSVEDSEQQLAQELAEVIALRQKVAASQGFVQLAVFLRSCLKTCYQSKLRSFFNGNMNSGFCVSAYDNCMVENFQSDEEFSFSYEDFDS